VDVDRIGGRFFSPAERAALHRLSGDRRRQGFFACWTRKEAYVKALGQGLCHDLTAFDVPLVPGASVTLTADDGRWHLLDLPVDGSYAAALVTRRAPGGLTVRVRDWQNDAVART
jgi:4'-phosphopantetheinyl transferase